MNKIIVLAFSLLQLYGCGLSEEGRQITDSGLNRTDFQTEIVGKKTDLFVLRNENGMEVCITNYGGRIVSVMVPDIDGHMRDVVLGFDSIQDYIKYPSDFGATIGRYANRINNGRTTIDGVEYQFPQNNFGHCLHGGFNGFQSQIFDTDMDFREAKSIGSRIDNYSFDQLKNGDGYDHNWVLNTGCDAENSCARLVSVRTGIVLDVYTTEPGIQFYAGNFLDGTLVGKGACVYNRRAAVCLETQKYPDTPNKKLWHSAELRTGERYQSLCIYKFSTSDKY